MQVNANGSLRRLEHGDIVLNLFPGTRWKAARRTSTCGASAPTSPGRRCSVRAARSPFHLDAHGLRATGEWQGVGIVAVARARRRGAGVVLARGARQSRQRGRQRRPRLRAGRRAGALRRDPHERVLRQPVRRSHAAHPPGTRVRARRPSEPGHGRTPSVGGDRLAAARRELRHRRAAVPRPRHPGRRGAGRAGRAAPSRRAAPARAFDGGHSGRAGATRARRPHGRAASSDGSSRITRRPLRRPILRRSIAPSPCRRRHHEASSAPLRTARSPPRRCSPPRHSCVATTSPTPRSPASWGERSAPRRARCRSDALLLPRRTHARGAARQGVARAAPARAPRAHRRSARRPTRRR